MNAMTTNTMTAAEKAEAKADLMFLLEKLTQETINPAFGTEAPREVFAKIDKVLHELAALAD
jgi:hypothetical protein